MTDSHLTLVTKLKSQLLDPVKKQFVGKDEIIDLLGITLVARENLFLHGPPGTAKSAIVHALANRIIGKTFDYLLTRFTEPNELFGPFDISRLKEGELVTNTDGMLPEAEVIFLDELFNANSAILNNLLTALNERTFRRGRETYQLPALTFVGASNNLPEDETLRALFDRFLIRASCSPVSDDQLRAVLSTGWQSEGQSQITPAISADEIRELQNLIPQVDLSASTDPYLELIQKLRQAGLDLSDRRAVRLQRVIAASAILSGRRATRPSDLWILRHIWDREEQIEILSSIVTSSLASFDEAPDDHPAASQSPAPDPERLNLHLDELLARAASATDSHEKQTLPDEARLIASQLEWLPDSPAKSVLQEKADLLWQQIPD
ncbi:MAG: MoxR-like ATPase [Akkermansiaceae bacterium]|jgi:MoxR-like ATPase